MFHSCIQATNVVILFMVGNSQRKLKKEKEIGKILFLVPNPNEWLPCN